MGSVDTTVLIVGAGPVGLMSSLLLTRLGVNNIVVDRREGPHRAPQAHCINARTLEICHTSGVDMQRLRELASPREDGSLVRWVTRLTGQELGQSTYERQDDGVLEVTPTPLLNLSQHLFEPVILDQLREDGTDCVRYRHQWNEMHADDVGVTSTIDNLDDDASYEIRSRYLLAADGAGSRVRKALGIGMDGPERLQSFVMIHFEANLRELVKDRPAILYWLLDPAAPGTFVAHDIDGTWVFMHTFDEENEAREDYDDARCARIVRHAIGRDDVDLEVRNVSIWTMTAQVADSYSCGRVFLVGDSAHRFPPTGGLGMNTGIQDAHNLAWKIAAVEHGSADAKLLDTYEIERRPIASNNAEQSLGNAMKIFEVFQVLEEVGAAAADDSPASFERALAEPGARARLTNAIDLQQEHFDMLGLQLGFSYEAGAVVPDGSALPAADNPVREHVPTTRPGSRLAHAWIERDGERISSLDLVGYDGFTLLAGRDGDGWRDAAASVSGATVRCLVADTDFADPTGHWASVCGIEADGALLVRPDQHVAWRATMAPSDRGAALSQVLEALLHPPSD